MAELVSSEGSAAVSATRLPILGTWVLDAHASRFDATRVTRLTVRATRVYDVVKVAVDGARLWPAGLPLWTRTWRHDGAVVLTGDNTYELRRCGESTVLALASPTTLRFTAKADVPDVVVLRKTRPLSTLRPSSRLRALVPSSWNVDEARIPKRKSRVLGGRVALSEIGDALCVAVNIALRGGAEWDFKGAAFVPLPGRPSSNDDDDPAVFKVDRRGRTFVFTVTSPTTMTLVEGPAGFSCSESPPPTYLTRR